MFILADTEKNSSKSFSSLADLATWVKGELGEGKSAPMDPTRLQQIKDSITHIRKLSELLQEIGDLPRYKNPDTSSNTAWEAFTESKEEGSLSAYTPNEKGDSEKKLDTLISSYISENSYASTKIYENTVLPDENKKDSPALTKLEAEEYKKKYLKNLLGPDKTIKRQSNFLQSSRWISPEDAGYKTEIGEDVNQIFKESYVGAFKTESILEERDTDEILERYDILNKQKKCITTERTKEFENKLIRWFSTCIMNAPQGSKIIELNIFWNLLLHSKGNKQIIGNVEIPEDILEILKNPELESYSSIFRNVEQAGFAFSTFHKVMQEGFFEEFKTILKYIESKNIPFQNTRCMDVIYKAYCGYYTNSIMIRDLEDWILAFVSMRLKKEDKDNSVKSSVLYTTFMEWLASMWGEYDREENSSFIIRSAICLRLRTTCSQKTFSSILKSVANMTSVRKADGVYWVGVALSENAGSVFDAGNTLCGMDPPGCYETLSPLETLPEKSVEQTIKEKINTPGAIVTEWLPSELVFGIKTSVPGKETVLNVNSEILPVGTKKIDSYDLRAEPKIQTTVLIPEVPFKNSLSAFLKQ